MVAAVARWEDPVAGSLAGVQVAAAAKVLESQEQEAAVDSARGPMTRTMAKCENQ